MCVLEEDGGLEQIPGSVHAAESRHDLFDGGPQRRRHDLASLLGLFSYQAAFPARVGCIVHCTLYTHIHTHTQRHILDSAFNIQIRKNNAYELETIEHGHTDISVKK